MARIMDTRQFPCGRYAEALEKVFDGAPDPMTLKLLAGSP